MRRAGVVTTVVAMFLLGLVFQQSLPATESRSGAASVTAASGQAPYERAPAPPAAASSALDMEVHIGFGGMFQTGSWAPLRIVLRAPARRIDGALRIAVPSDGRFRGGGVVTSYIHPLALPAGSVYQVKTIVPIQGPTRPLRASVEADVVTLASREMDLARSFSDDGLAIAVTGEAHKIPQGLALAATGFATCEAATEDLPDDPLGYDGVRAAIVCLSASEHVSDSQIAALESWVRSGGAAIFVADAGAPSALPARMTCLAPVEVTGKTQVTSFRSLARRYGGELQPRGAAVVLSGRVKSGATILAEDEGVPLVSVTHVGAGSTALVAFDPYSAPFDKWAGIAGIWRELLPSPSEAAPAGVGDIARSVLWNTRILYPRVRPVLVFAAAYVGVTLVVLILLRRAALFPHAFAAAVCSLSAVFLVLAWRLVVPFARSSTLAVSSLAIVESYNMSGTARVRTYVGALPLTDRVADFAFPGPAWHVAGDGPARSPGARQELEVTCGRAGPALLSLGLQEGEITVFRGETAAAFALSAVIEKAQGGVSLAITNGTGMRLEDANVVIGEKAVSLGAIPDGRTTIYSLSGPAVFVDATSQARERGIENLTGLWTDSQLVLRQALVDQLVIPVYVRKQRAGGRPAAASWPVLVAWAAGSPDGAAISGVKANVAEVTLVMLHLPELDIREAELR